LSAVSGTDNETIKIKLAFVFLSKGFPSTWHDTDLACRVGNSHKYIQWTTDMRNIPSYQTHSRKVLHWTWRIRR